MSRLKIILLYQTADMLVDKLIKLSIQEKDEVKYRIEKAKLVKRIDRMFAKAYEDEEFNGERQFLKTMHEKLQTMLDFNQGLRP